MTGETPPPGPAPKQAVEPGSATDDGARRDGGNTTEDEPVSRKKMNDLAHTAIDHTREEPGS